MPDIIITPGTFNPPAPLAVVHGVLDFPKTPFQQVKRPAMQFQSRHVAVDETPPVVEEPYDDSPIIMPATDLWLVDENRSYFPSYATRRFALDFEWRGMPAGTKINGELSQGDGSRLIEIYFRIEVKVYPEFVYNDLRTEIADELNGRDFSGSDFSQQVVNIPYGTGGNLAEVTYRRQGTSGISLEVLNSANVSQASMGVGTQIATTCRMRRGAPSSVTTATGRSIRLTYSVENGYSLQMPSDWLLSYS